MNWYEPAGTVNVRDQVPFDASRWAGAQAGSQSAAQPISLWRSPTSVTVERGSDVWLWVPEDAPGVDCSATDSEGLGLEPRWLLRQLTNDDLVSALVMPSGSTGTFEIACEPADDGQLVPAPATAHVGVAPAPSADRVAAYYTLTRVSTAGLVVVGAATVVLWILWGVLRAARVLPRLR